VRLSGEAAGYSDGRPRSLALTGEDDVIPRGYRHGDDLRRVHWRSTARYGELMVRREEQPRRPRCTVLLDTRRSAYQGSGPDSAFEWAVSGAASATAHLLERGFSVRLLTDTGSSVPGPDGAGGFTGHSADSAGLLLDTLAVVSRSEERGLSRAYEALRGGDVGLLVAFLGLIDEEQAGVLGRMRQRGGAAVAFVLESAAWAGDGRGADQRRLAERHRMLREAGWTALPVAPGQRLPELWRQAGERAAGAGAAAGGPAGETR
jgi:uncharacterized protein (DUF58 family)